MKKKILVTGAAGFIGSNLVPACLERGWDVLGVDNFSTGDRAAVNKERFVGLSGKFSFAEIDIRDTQFLAKLIETLNVEYIVHMAALPRVAFSTDFPIQSNQANINGTLSVLEAARQTKIKRVVYSASSSMYGGSDIPFPTPETTPAHPRSNYALQKYVGLEYCRLYSELYGLDTVSLIYFNVFGPHQKADNAYSGAIAAFFDAAMKNKPCRIDGDGTQSRDWCYVGNVVQANIYALEYLLPLGGDYFNIACGRTYSVNDVFDAVQKYTGKRLDKICAPPRKGDPYKSHADISKVMGTLGYMPRYYFDDGMEKTAQWWLGGCKY